MKPSIKIGLGAAVILGSVALLMVEGIKQTGTYFLTPTQLAERINTDPTFHDVGIKVAAKVVEGSIRRDAAAQRVDFKISDGTKTFPVTYTGLVPDTFTDANDIDVVVEGKLGRDGVFQATDVIAKCGSRYEAEWNQPLASTS